MNRINSGSRPRVSVVMTVFEPSPIFFAQAIESVLAQTMRDWELVVVEDPSPTGLSGIAPQYADRRIRYFSGTRRTSLVEQRNRALSEARAQLVALLDCDDVAEPDRLERQVEYMAAHPRVDVLGSQVAVIDSRGEIVGHRLFPRDHAGIARAMRRMVPLCHSSVLYRKATIERAGGYSDRLVSIAEDYDLYSRLLLTDARFANHPEALTRYRLHGGQAKARRLRETIRAVLKVKKRYWANTMSLGDRWRMWAETCLLVMPEAVVWKLLTNCQYRDRPPKPACGLGDDGPSCLANTGAQGNVRHAGIFTLGSRRPTGANVCMVDGHVQFLSQDTEVMAMQALGTRGGGEAIDNAATK